MFTVFGMNYRIVVCDLFVSIFDCCQEEEEEGSEREASSDQPSDSIVNKDEVISPNKSKSQLNPFENGTNNLDYYFE